MTTDSTNNMRPVAWKHNLLKLTQKVENISYLTKKVNTQLNNIKKVKIPSTKIFKNKKHFGIKLRKSYLILKLYT